MSPPRKKASKRGRTTGARPRSRPGTGERKGGVVLIVALRARQGQEAALERELRALVGPTRAERGCIAYDLHVSSDQPGLFLLREIWASLKHHARHWETPHMKLWAARKDAVLAGREASF
jgi:quinol monooxygenase YgiN